MKDFTDGTYYDGWSFFAAVDKRINDRNLFSFVAFATPTENGRQGASVQEMVDIAGNNFLVHTGVTRMEEKNVVAKSFQPIGIPTTTGKFQINKSCYRCFS